MPRKSDGYLAKMLQKPVDDLMNHIIDNTVKIAEENLVKAHKEITSELVKDANRIYKEIVIYFYLYETKKYIRFGQNRPGTQTGIRVYKGRNTEISTSKYKKWTVIDNVSIGYDGSQMPNYRNSAGEDISGSDVMNNIAEGIRFPNQAGRGDMTWKIIQPRFHVKAIHAYIDHPKTLNEMIEMFDIKVEKKFPNELKKRFYQYFKDDYKQFYSTVFKR